MVVKADKMPIRVGVENGAEGRTILWLLDHPGCFSYGKTTLEAFHFLPIAVQEYNLWLIQHGLVQLTLDLEQPVQIEETWEVYYIDEDYDISLEGYEVNAWFQADWKPLTEHDCHVGSQLLTASRIDLLSAVNSLNEEALNTQLNGERWSILGILNHVAKAEWWYLDRLQLAIPYGELPAEPMEKLAEVRTLMLATLPGLASSTQVVGIDGEFWSPRKVLRRAVWHERDHTAHIQRLISIQ
jgi:hypothetical protein